jgi:hypothetical protein
MSFGYRVSVYDADRINKNIWWRHFITSLIHDNVNFVNWEDMLPEHNCRNVLGTDMIEFDSEKDFIIFKLKFS